MRRLGVFLPLVALLGAAAAGSWDPETGTIHNERWDSGLPLGGIGCGKVELLTDGGFGSLTTQHNWDRPTGVLRGAFFAIAADGEARVLRRHGPDEYANVTAVGDTRATMQFPRGTIRFADEGLPVDVELRALSPLVPSNVADSALPVALLDLTVTSRADAEQTIAVALAWPNLVGFGGRPEAPQEVSHQRRVRDCDIGPLTGLGYDTTEGPSDDDPRRDRFPSCFSRKRFRMNCVLSAPVDATMSSSSSRVLRTPSLRHATNTASAETMPGPAMLDPLGASAAIFRAACTAWSMTMDGSCAAATAADTRW